MSTLTIQSMVYNRLRMLEVSDRNNDAIQDFFEEACYELNKCFGKSPEDVAIEVNYDTEQKSILADMVTVMMLVTLIGVGLGGDNQTGGAPILPSVKYLKKAKADVSDVEWGVINVNENVGLYSTADSLITMYKKSAFRKGRTYGCILDICETCTEALKYTKVPFVIVQDAHC